MNQRGFSLLEVVIVAAIVATVAAFFFSPPVSSEPAATHAAVAQLDAALAYARAYASAHGGATLAFLPRNNGVEVDVPNAPPFERGADLQEKTLGRPPFSITLDAAGEASTPACPAGGWVLTVRAGAGSAGETIPCLP